MKGEQVIELILQLNSLFNKIVTLFVLAFHLKP